MGKTTNLNWLAGFLNHQQYNPRGELITAQPGVEIPLNELHCSSFFLTELSLARSRVLILSSASDPTEKLVVFPQTQKNGTGISTYMNG